MECTQYESEWCRYRLHLMLKYLIVLNWVLLYGWLMSTSTMHKQTYYIFHDTPQRSIWLLGFIFALTKRYHRCCPTTTTPTTKLTNKICTVIEFNFNTPLTWSPPHHYTRNDEWAVRRCLHTEFSNILPQTRHRFHFSFIHSMNATVSIFVSSSFWIHELPGYRRFLLRFPYRIFCP